MLAIKMYAVLLFTAKLAGNIFLQVMPEMNVETHRPFSVFASCLNIDFVSCCTG
jgi:hypothetical protein